MLIEYAVVQNVLVPEMLDALQLSIKSMDV